MTLMLALPYNFMCDVVATAPLLDTFDEVAHKLDTKRWELVILAG